MAEGGARSSLTAHRFDSALETNLPPDASTTPDPHTQVWQRLINRGVPQNELTSLIETTVSGAKTADIIDLLHGLDAQACIDFIDEVLHCALPFPRNGLIYFSFILHILASSG